MEITSTQTQEEGADNVNSTVQKCYGIPVDMLILRLAVLFFTYPGIGRKALKHL